MRPIFRPSKCQSFDVFAERIHVPLLGPSSQGSIPIERRCRQGIYIDIEEPLGTVLLVPGFAANRHIFDLGGGNGNALDFNFAKSIDS
jgi:hypothetical protein